MLFAIHCLDREDALPVRMDNITIHRAYLEQAPVDVVMSGPLMKDDGETMIGSLFLVEAADRAAVEAFNKADPFFAAGIWESVHIHAFLRRHG